jgi:hypothetical protein
VDVLGGPNGYNVVLVSIAEEGAAADLDKVVEEVVAGVIFEPPEVPEVVGNAGG